MNEQQKLAEICFDMRKIALVASPAYKDDTNRLTEKWAQKQYNFNQLFDINANWIRTALNSCKTE